MPERSGESLSSPQTPDAHLAEALKPTVAAALRRSVRDDPRIWVEAFFPILLPAVRMAVASALREMLTNLNQILEHSLSFQSWRWRLESWRTGKKFGEIVLLRTLVYRVEQVLLLDRHTGLPLASVAAPDITPKDTDLVAGMLTALQDFVGHSFGGDRDARIHELYVGNFSLVVEQGPRAALATAVRGHAPAELRETLRAAIDLIHQEFASELSDFAGDPKPFERSRTILEGCLQAQYRVPDVHSNRKLYAVAVIAGLIVAGWIGFWMRQAWRWNRALAELQNMHGIVITSADSSYGRYFLEGLRDPLAASPENLLSRHGIDVRKVGTRFRPFISLDPPLVMQRAHAAIEAPAGVSISLDGGVLKLHGTASHAWILHAKSAGKGLAMAGIREVRTGDLVDSDLEALGREIRAIRILFAINSSELAPEQTRIAAMLADKVQHWTSGAIHIGRVPRLEIVGYADATGTEERNRELSRERAERVLALHAARGIAREHFKVRGGGASTEHDANATHQRRVLIRPYLATYDATAGSAR